MNKPKINKDGILAVIGILTIVGMSLYGFYVFSQSISAIQDFIYGIAKTSGF